MKHTLLATLLLAAACTAQAAEKIKYDEIPGHIGSFGAVIQYRGITVTTLEGRTYSGRRLRLETDHVRVFPMDPNAWIDIPAENVARITISQTGRYIHHVTDNATLAIAPFFLCEDTRLGCALLAALLTPPLLAYTAVSAPVFLAGDAFAFFIPPKVYEIIH